MNFLNCFYFIAGLLLVAQVVNTSTFDLSQTGMSGSSLQNTICNKDTVIDFKFNAGSQLKSCSSTASSCAITNSALNTLSFLDINGQQLIYTLTSAKVMNVPAGGLSRLSQQYSFVFSFMNGVKTVNIYVPFRKTSTGATYESYEYQLSNAGNSDPAFNSLKNIGSTASTGLALSAFNFLNELQWGNFYSFPNSRTPTTTDLVSSWVYVVSGFDTTTAEPSSPSGVISPIVYSIADKLCFGSFTQGIFQTHLRQSYPLWAAWLGIFFFWIFLVAGQPNEIGCHDKQYEQNKWTCWAFYSLHFLGDEEYFTKLLRTCQLLITFCWQMLCLALLYNFVGPSQNRGMIIWFPIVAVVTSMPFTYVLGNIFHTRIYRETLQKYDTLKSIAGIFNKKDNAAIELENKIDTLEESLYGLYYWYYVCVFVFFAAFSTLAIHFMQQLSRDYYYLQHYWLASLAIGFALQNLVFDPILTAILGNTTFYRNRGFYYDIKLAERAKQVEQ